MAKGGSASDVCIAQCAQLRRAKRGDALEHIACWQGRVERDFTGEVRDQRELGRALDQRVAGEDLLDQSRSRALQAKNEYRRIRGRALIGAGAQEIGGVERDRSIDFGGKDRSPRINRRGAQAIAGGIMVECGDRLATVLERLGEREMERDAVVVAARGEQLLHRRDIVVGEAKLLEIRQHPPRSAIAGLNQDRVTQRGHRFVGAAERLERIGQADPQAGELRLHRHQLAQSRNLLVMLAKFAKQIGLMGEPLEIAVRAGREIAQQAQRIDEPFVPIRQLDRLPPAREIGRIIHASVQACRQARS